MKISNFAAYIAQLWRNKPDTSTPLSAERLRHIEDGIKEGNERCILAQKMFVNSVIKYIAQYYVLLGHVDVIAFTAGIGEKSISTRSDIIERLAPLGIEIDPEENNVRGKFKKISSKKSSVDIYVVPTNEELMIAEDTLNLIK